MRQVMKSLLACSVIAVSLNASLANAAPNRCASHTAVVERLADVYGERRQAIGLAGNDTVVEVYASDESGSWSITITRPGGPTCLVAAGQNFQLEEAVIPEDPDA